MTEEQKAARNAALARARDASKAKREAAKAAEVIAAPVAAPEAEEAPLAMPGIGQNWREPVAEPEPEAAEEVEADDPFERFLAAQDAETRSILSDVELRVIYEADLKKQQEAKREAAKKVVAARASRFNRTNLGLISPADAAHAEWQRKMNRRVTFTPEIPQDANGNLIDQGYRVNGQIIFHGLPWTGTYAEFLSLREQQWRAMNHEMDFEGKGRLSQQRQLSAQALTAKL